jgi:hypothetical protein
VLVDAIKAESCVVGALFALVHTGSAGVFRSAVLTIGAFHCIDAGASSSFSPAFRTDALVIYFDVAVVRAESAISRVVAAVGAAVMAVVAPTVSTVVSSLRTPNLTVVLTELSIPELISPAFLWNTGRLADPVILLLAGRTSAVDAIVSDHKGKSTSSAGASRVLTLLTIVAAGSADPIFAVLSLLTAILDAGVISAFVSESGWALAVSELIEVKACLACVTATRVVFALLTSFKAVEALILPEKLTSLTNYCTLASSVHLLAFGAHTLTSGIFNK